MFSAEYSNLTHGFFGLCLHGTYDPLTRSFVNMNEVSDAIFRELDSPEIVQGLIKQWMDQLDPSSHELLFK